MKLTTLTSLGLAAAFASAALAPALADGASTQKNKNLWRNGAIAAGAAAVYGLHNKDVTTTVLGAAGAAYAAKRYEDERHSQSQASRARARYHRTTNSSSGRKYYSYMGQRYYLDRATGQRHLAD